MAAKKPRAAEPESPDPQQPLPTGQGDVPGAGWVPVPDPSKLTTDQLRRELNALRELLETRLTASDVATELRIDTTARLPQLMDEKVRHLRELEDEKLRGLLLLIEEKICGAEAKETAGRELQAVKFAGQRELVDERAVAAKEALAAALQAAKELVTASGEATAKAAEKAEANTTKLIDQIAVLIKTSGEASDARLVEIKERIDRGEGGTSGAQSQRAEQRLNTGQLIAIFAAVMGLLTLIVVTGGVIASIVLTHH